jgi:hypothetical protein
VSSVKFGFKPKPLDQSTALAVTVRFTISGLITHLFDLSVILTNFLLISEHFGTVHFVLISEHFGTVHFLLLSAHFGTVLFLPISKPFGTVQSGTVHNGIDLVNSFSRGTRHYVVDLVTSDLVTSGITSSTDFVT